MSRGDYNGGVYVISGDHDGAELRRQKRKNEYHVRCTGKDDDQVIQEVINTQRAMTYSIPAQAWDRIFGGKK